MLVGSVVHDSAVVSWQLADFPITGTVTYTLSQAEGTAALPGAETVAVGTDSSPFTVSVWGHYQYSVSYAGNGDYNPATSAAEPFQAYRGAWVSPGFWKSTNGAAAWALVAPITKASLFNSTAGVPPYYSGTALGAKVTLGDLLTGGAGQYGGAAFNAVGAFLTDQLKPYGYMSNGSTTSGLNPIGSGGHISP